MSCSLVCVAVVRRRRGFTLVELLVVIAIIGVLVSLLLPAVQAARESARRMQCANQIRQLALAVLSHEETHGYFPSGGWGWNWVGDPDRGFGESQPGPWTYSVLPYMEQMNLWSMSQGETNPVTKRKLLSDMNAIQPDGFICPTRRPSVATGIKPHWTPVNCNRIPESGKSDYAINVGGDALVTDYWDLTGPSMAQVNNPNFPNNFPWPTPEKDLATLHYTFNGVNYPHNELRLAEITDGTTNTYLVGEKYLRVQSYNGVGASGSATYDTGDNETIFTGFNRDYQRSTVDVPLQDREGVVLDNIFGSAHASVMNMSLCDASVQVISYDIDPVTYRLMGIRNDGTATSSGK